MARIQKTRSEKRAIYVFCEGQSEQAYIWALRRIFDPIADIRVHKQTGLFHDAAAAFRNDKALRDHKSSLDEIWFFFDTEPDMTSAWGEYEAFKKTLNTKHVNIRLLMTKSCVEYWFLLHFECTNKAIQTPADKENIRRELCAYAAAYQKGDKTSITSMAQHWRTAIRNAETVMRDLERRGELAYRNPQERDKELFETNVTFTTVHEALIPLMQELDHCAVNRDKG